MLNPIIQSAFAVIAALGVAGFAANASAANPDFTCGVSTTAKGGMVAIEGRLLSPTPLSGDYRFALKSSGNGGTSNISQGGPFSAAPNSEVLLGNVMLNANARFNVDFTITADGKKFDCSQSATRT